MSTSRFVYADNAATTQISKLALDAMMPYLTTEYGNPSSLYRHAGRAKKALEEARATIAACIGATPDEIFFTSGGTEADNWAIRGTALAKARKGKHIITSSVEHHAVSHTLEQLGREGFEVTWLPVDEKGNLTAEQVKAAIRPDTILITIMAANNEIGTIYPVEEIGKVARDAGVTFHTDAVQAAGHIPLKADAWGVDLMSLAAHKFHGPKGMGALYIRKGVSVMPLILGGGQEKNRRSGTENVAGAVGMAAALKDAVDHMDENMARVSRLRDKLIAGLTKLPKSRLTGDPVNRLPGTASFVFEGIEGESIVLQLDARGICASSGSACSSVSLEPSHVLLAIGLPHEIAHGSVRLSISEATTEEDVDYILEALPQVVGNLRAMSPMWTE